MYKTSRIAICDEIVRLFVQWYGRLHPHQMGTPALEPAAARPFFLHELEACDCRPRASHARADRCAHCPTPSGRPKACHDFLFEFRRRAAAAGDEQGVAAAEGGDRR